MRKLRRILFLEHMLGGRNGIGAVVASDEGDGDVVGDKGVGSARDGAGSSWTFYVSCLWGFCCS